MSEIKKKILGPVITKKQIIWVIVTAGLLVTAFAFSAYAFSLILGTNRDDPSDELDKAEYENAKHLTPHFPFDLDDLADWLLNNYDIDDLNASLSDLEALGIDTSNISPQDLEKLLAEMTQQEIDQFVQNMMDGDVDNYNLANAGLAIAALLFSEVEVFRVFDYPRPISSDREDILWKYEAYDLFNRYEWQSTVPMEQTVYPDIADPGSDVNKIQQSLSVIQGSNSMALGSRFNEFVKPSIIKDSIVANNLDQTLYFYDELGSSSVHLYFNQAGPVNMTYNVFGIDLRTNDDINNTAAGTNKNPSDPDFQKFLQLPGGVSNYIGANLYFRTHRDNLVGVINGNDNAFMVANKIRNYLQFNFDYTFDALVNDAPGDTEDVVEWFSEHGEGMSSEFASAFVAFARSFGVGARFIDGFNSQLIQELNDTSDNPFYPIKYKNIYNWAEVYIPTQTGGSWVQMDILYDTYGLGGAPVGPDRYNISVLANYSDYNQFNRNDYVNITAELNSTFYNIDGLTVTFEDLTTNQVLGNAITDPNGLAWLLVQLDDTHRVGPHRVEGSVLRSDDDTYYLLNDEIRVILENVSPAEVNVSVAPHTTFVQGYVEDPLNSQVIEGANVNFLLLYKGTNNPVNVPNSFNPMSATTDINGRFDTTLDVADYNPYGEYDFRVDFNGSWILAGPPFLFINDSSNVMDFNITKEVSYEILFFVNGTPTEYPFGPTQNNLIVAKRFDNINLTAFVIDAETKNRVSGVPVEFHDYMSGFIGSDVSGANGNSSMSFNIGAALEAGPRLVFAKIGSIINYSYYIINESISINVTSYTSPLQLDISAGIPETYNIQCRILDDQNNYIRYSQLEILMNRSSIDYSSFITPFTIVNPVSVGSYDFDFDRGVQSFTPTYNYSLKLEFNGYYDLSSFPYIATFNLNYLSNFTYLQDDLEVIDGNLIEIFLAVEGNPTSDIYDSFYQPQNYTRGSGQDAHFQVRVVRAGGGIPVTGGTVRIYDDYTNKLLDSYTFNSPAGFVQFNISTDKFYHAGIHKIRVQFSTFPNINTTLIVINETVNILPNLIINVDNEITREIESFSVLGVVEENGTNLRGLVLRILLFDQNFVNVTSNLIGNQFAITDSNGNFQFDIIRINGSLLQGSYYIRIDFNGTIYLSGEVPRIDPIQNYMNQSSSILIPINITAETYIIQDGYHTSEKEIEYPDFWVFGTTLYVYGSLNWDNSSGIIGAYVNISIIKISDNSVIAYNDTVLTIIGGIFNGSLLIDDSWPTLRSDTIIIVTFLPINTYNFPEYYYIEESSIVFT